MAVNVLQSSEEKYPFSLHVAFFSGPLLCSESGLPRPDSEQIWTHIIFDSDVTMSLGEKDVWLAEQHALIDTQDDSVVSVHLAAENLQSERLFLHPVNKTGPNVGPCGAPAPLPCRGDFTSVTPNSCRSPWSMTESTADISYFCKLTLISDDASRVRWSLDLFKQIAVCCLCGIIFF